METPTEKPKNLLHKLQEGMDDREEQMAILGAFVRLGVVIWSGFIITLNYVEIPMFKKSPGGDITFPASILQVPSQHSACLHQIMVTVKKIKKKKQNEEVLTTFATTSTFCS